MSPTAPEIPGHQHVRGLDSGGFADVYVYRQLMPAREVAVKVLKGADLSAPAREQFAAEATVMAELTGHENIVRVLSAGELPDGRPYLVMEFYSNGDLRARVARQRLSVAEVVDIGVRIASAVGTAHHEKILHRDIKPSNILLSKHDVPALTDFGIASTLAAASSAPADHLSLLWSPPEALSNQPSTVRSDLFSLAATLWHLLVGHSPFEIPGGDNSERAVMSRIMTAAAPQTGRADVSDRLERLFRRTMAKDPVARPESAAEFARGLRLVQEEMGGELTPITIHGDVAPAQVAFDPAPANATRQSPVVVTEAQLPKATVARITRHEAETPPTVHRPVQIRPDEPPPPPETGKPRRWILAGALAAVMVMAVVGAVVLLSSGGNLPAVVTAPKSVQPQQNAGALGENEPPGTPAVVVARSNPSTLHFTWTYSAALASDTFLWRTTDGAKSGTARDNSLDVTDPTGVRFCVQIKVVRVAGDGGGTDYSPAACGT